MTTQWHVPTGQHAPTYSTLFQKRGCRESNIILCRSKMPGIAQVIRIKKTVINFPEKQNITWKWSLFHYVSEKKKFFNCITPEKVSCRWHICFFYYQLGEKYCPGHQGRNLCFSLNTTRNPHQYQGRLMGLYFKGSTLMMRSTTSNISLNVGPGLWVEPWVRRLFVHWMKYQKASPRPCSADINLADCMTPGTQAADELYLDSNFTVKFSLV